MASNIYNFFNFLEKKAGKTLPADKNFDMKLQHAKELVTDKDIIGLSIEKKIKFYPEKVKGEELIVQGDLDLLHGTKALPEGLDVRGTLRVDSLEQVPVNIKARSVVWNVSSDLYPKSFNGATFENFSAGNKCTKFPQGIKIVNKLSIINSKIETLPEGLELKSIYLLGPSIKYIPSQLTCDILDMRTTSITEIPEGVVIREKLIVDKIPAKYPKYLEDIISIDGELTGKELKQYKALPEISIKIGNKTKKGRGMEIPFSNIDTEELINTLKSFKSYRNPQYIKEDIKETNTIAGSIFNFKPDTVSTFIKPDSINRSFDITYLIYGKDNKNRELLFTEDVAISAEGQASIKGYKYNSSPTERQLKDTMSKLFPKSNEGEKPVKAVPIRQLMNGTGSKRVFWKIDRKQRGGNGVQGKAKDLIPSLSGASQDNMEAYAKRKGVTWGDMMVFDNEGSINIIARSNEKTEEGKYIYFDKFGYGQGGGSRTFEGSDYIVL